MKWFTWDWNNKIEVNVINHLIKWNAEDRCIAETIYSRSIWSRTCSTSCSRPVVVTQSSSMTLSTVLVALVRQWTICCVICHSILANSTIISGLKALYNTRYTGNSSIDFSADFRTKFRHRRATREKPLLPSSCTLWKWLLISWVEQVEMVKVKIYEHTFTQYRSSQMKYKIEEWSLDVSYFIDMALNFDFRDSEIDWRSDGPAPSWFIGEEWLVELLQTDKKWSYKCLAKKSIQ